MEILRNGKFSLPIRNTDLKMGLRKLKTNLVNEHSLIECNGAVGMEGVLQRLSELVRTYELDAEFPYPQIFVETNVIIVCTKYYVYEVQGGELILKHSVVGGSTWSLISSHDFVYMSNGAVSVVRDPITKQYSEVDVPTAMAICNYNGQILIGAPNAGYNLGD